MIFSSFTSAPILAAVGTVWPAYATYKAVVAQDAATMSRWLQFWLISAIFSSLEVFLDMVGYYMPFYYEAKICFLLWLMMDKFKGATVLFEKYLKPQLEKHSPAIDEQIEFVSARAANLKMEDLRTFAEWLQAKKAELTEAGAAAAKAATKAPEQADKPQEPDEKKDDDLVDVSTKEEEKKDK